MKGYDLGGAEYPYDPENLTVIDIQEPYEDAEFLIRDLSKPDWNKDLERRERVYLGKVLRYLPASRSLEFAAEIDKILLPGGRVEMFDQLDVILYLAGSFLVKGMYELFSAKQINPSIDGDPAEYLVVLMRK